MKRKILFAITLFTSSALLAQPAINISQFTPRIDGEIDAGWNSIPSNAISFEYENDFGQASIIDAWFKMSFSDTAFYLLVYREDDDFAHQWKTGLADWESDRDEIYFNVNVNHLDESRGAIMPGTSYGCYQFTSIWQANEEGDNIEPTFSGWPNQWYHNAPFEFAYKVTGNSYVTEYVFPFSSLRVDTDSVPDADSIFVLNDGVPFGFEIAMADVDMADSLSFNSGGEGSHRKFLMWAGTSGWDDMQLAGRISTTHNHFDPFPPYPPYLFIHENTHENSKGEIHLYPNPVVNELTIEYPASGKQVLIEIYSVTGQLCYKSSVISEQASKVDVSFLEQGFYTMRITTENNLYAQRFQKL